MINHFSAFAAVRHANRNTIFFLSFLLFFISFILFFYFYSFFYFFFFLHRPRYVTSVRYAPSRPLFAGFRHFSLPPPPSFLFFFLRVAARKRIDSLKIHSPADIVPQFVLREIVERGEQYSAIRSPITINWSLSPSSSSDDNSNPSARKTLFSAVLLNWTMALKEGRVIRR